MTRKEFEKHVETWKKMLSALHPRYDLPQAEERNRIEIATMLFNHEARVAMLMLIGEATAMAMALEARTNEVAELKRRLAHANHLVKETREKNKKLRER